MIIEHVKYGFRAKVVHIFQGVVVFDTSGYGRGCCRLDEFKVIEEEQEG